MSRMVLSNAGFEICAEARTSSLINFWSWYRHSAHKAHRGEIEYGCWYAQQVTQRLVGDLELPPFAAYRQMAAGGKPAKTVEVFCKPEDSKTGNILIICLVCIVRMVENYPVVELLLRPRLVIMNNLFFNEMQRHLWEERLVKNTMRIRRRVQRCITFLHFKRLKYIMEAHLSYVPSFAQITLLVVTGQDGINWRIDIPIKLNSRLKAPIRCQFRFLNFLVKSSRLKVSIQYQFPSLNALVKESKFAGGVEFFIREERCRERRDTGDRWLPDNFHYIVFFV